MPILEMVPARGAEDLSEQEMEFLKGLWRELSRQRTRIASAKSVALAAVLEYDDARKVVDALAEQGMIRTFGSARILSDLRVMFTQRGLEWLFQQYDD